MTRKLATTGLAVLALAGIAGTGAAFASPDHSSTTAASAASHERSMTDRNSKDTSRDTHSSHRVSAQHELKDSSR